MNLLTLKKIVTKIELIIEQQNKLEKQVITLTNERNDLISRLNKAKQQVDSLINSIESQSTGIFDNKPTNTTNDSSSNSDIR